MKRRDTIIIAVLVNAGLLMILFATAMRSKKEESPSSIHFTEMVEAPKEAIPLPEEMIALAPPPAMPLIEETPVLAEAEEVIFSNDIALAMVPKAPVEVAAPVAPKEDHSFVNVTVKKGDFLERIAKANHTTVSAIMKANKMTTTQLRVGQVLRVPLQSVGANIPKASVAAASVGQEGNYYVVKEGDNPWLIASKNQVRLDELLRLNGLDENKARRLRPGDRLRIR